MLNLVNATVASFMERAALEAAVESLSGAVYKTMQNRTSSLARKSWERIYYLSKTALGEWFAKNRAVEEKVWDGIAFEELKGLRIQIEKGVELARKWCNVRVWTSDKKDKYTTKILDLDKSLQALAVRLKIPLDVSIQTNHLARHM